MRLAASETIISNMYPPFKEAGGCVSEKIHGRRCKYEGFSFAERGS
jgi:hypothetical protein